MHRLLREQGRDGVGELDLAAGARCGALQNVEDAAVQYVAPDHRQIARRHVRPGFFDDAVDPRAAPDERIGIDDAIAAGLCVGYILHRDHAVAGGLGRIRHLLERAGATGSRLTIPDQIVRQQHRERLVADDRLRAQHRMTEAQRLRLGHEHRADMRRQDIAHQIELFVLAGFLQLLLQLVGLVEIIGHRMFVAIGDEHQRVAARFDRLVHRVLDQRLVDDRQHLLGHRLGGREESGAEAGDGENRFTDAGHRHWSTSGDAGCAAGHEGILRTSTGAGGDIVSTRERTTIGSHRPGRQVLRALRAGNATTVAACAWASPTVFAGTNSGTASRSIAASASRS